MASLYTKAANSRQLAKEAMKKMDKAPADPTIPAPDNTVRGSAEKTNRQQGAEKMNGAVEKTRTSTGCPTATSTLRVYQFRHDRTP